MEQENEQKASFGMKLLSFLIPLVGLILFACNVSNKPKYAKGCGIAAVIGFITGVVVIPIVVTIIISVIGFNIYNDAQEALEESTTSLSSQAVLAFNSIYENYQGDDVKGTKVRTLISMVKNHNLMDDEMQIVIFVDGVKMNTSGTNITINASKTYDVKMNYDSEGYINKIRITSNV